MNDVTADGSPVPFYLAFPAGNDAEIVHGVVPAGGAVLELGCGAGRTTRELVRLGHPVVAVDDSAEMLAHVKDAEAVQASIEELNLGRRFAGVLLASHLINTQDDAQRSAFLVTCERHVSPDGAVVIQRTDPAWAATATEGITYDEGGVRVGLRGVARDGQTFSAVAVYEVGEDRWEQPYTARILDDAAIETDLAAAGLALRKCLDAAWFVAESIRGQ